MREDADVTMHEASNARLLAMLPDDQFERVTNSEVCEIDAGFLGFVAIYERLAEIIPTHWTVVDIGCCYAAQTFFFRSHKAYIGVDLAGIERFCAPNTKHYDMSAEDFIDKYLGDFEQSTTFAICSYVPLSHAACDLVRRSFQNLFVYYPAGESVRALGDRIFQTTEDERL